MALAESWPMWASLAIIAGAIVAYALDRFAVEVVSAATLVAFLLLFQIAPVRDAAGENRLSVEALLSGFAEPALVAVMALLVLGQGLFQAGVMAAPTRLLARAGGAHGRAILVGVLALAMTISAFLNDTPVVVMFLPLVAAIAAASGVAPSRVMMPLSFAALFGGMTTVVGSSTNILAAGVYESLTGEAMGMFDLTPMALVICATGIIYFATAGRLLLPRRDADAPPGEREEKLFIARLDIVRGHFLEGKTIEGAALPEHPGVVIRLVLRNGEALAPPPDRLILRDGDAVIAAATRRTLAALFERYPALGADALADGAGANGAGRLKPLTIIEGVVAPGSRMVGRTLAQINFRNQTNCIILGIERRSRILRSEMATIRLDEGDVLLILGAVEDVAALRSDRDLILLADSLTELPAPGRAGLAAAIFACAITLAVTGVLSLPVSAAAGAFLMLATGCLNWRQAGRAFDRRIYLLIGTSLAMGLALEETGGAALFGELIGAIAAQFGPAALLSAVFAVSAAITNVLSNNATAVLLTPIAVSAAQAAGIDPLPLALTVIYGANCPFATPIAYQTNLLVMTPGRYRFADFLKVGGPLVVAIWLVYSLAAPAYFSAVGLM